MAHDGTIKIGTEILQDGLKKGMSVITGSIKKASQIAIGAMGAAATGIAAVGAASITVGEEFESSFAKASTLFGDVAVDTDHLKQSILAVSDATGVAASELNESLYSALSAGVPVTENMGEATAFLESSAKLAKAGFTDMDTALSATAKTLNAYGMDISQADDIQKILIQTQNKGITTVGELGASLSQVTPTAAAFGVAFDQVGAALSNMTAQGTPTAQATTQLNSLIAELGKSGTIGAKSLEKAAQGTKYAGMGFKQMMESGASLNEVLDLMAKDAEKSGLSMVDMFSSIEAGKASLALSGENSQKFADNLEAMSTSADVVTEAYEKVTNTLEAKTGQIANSSKNLGIQIYNGIQEPLIGLADKGIEYMSQLSEAMKTDGISGMVEVGASILAEIAVGIAENIPELIDMAADMVLTFIEAIKTNLPQIVTAGIDIISSLADGIMDILPELLSLGGTLLLELVNGISEKLPELIPAAYETIMTLVEGFLDNIDKIIDAGINLLLALTDGLINTLPMLLEKAPVIIEKLCTALTENMPKIIEAAMQIIMAINKGIVENLPLIIECAIKIIAAIAKGLIDSVGAAAESAGNVVNVIKDEFANFDWNRLGSDILNGISKGIKGAVSSVKDAAKNAASSVLDTFKNFFDIHSPSRVMRDLIGRNMIAGIGVGLKLESDGLNNQAGDIIEDVMDSMSGKLRANEFVANMQAEPLRKSIELESIYGMKYIASGGTNKESGDDINYASMGKEMKKALNGTQVAIDGKKTGQIVAPKIDQVNGQDDQRKGMFTA